MTDQRAREIGKQILEQSDDCKGVSDCLDLMERIIAAALADERRRGLDAAAAVVLQTVIKLDVDWMRTATKAEIIAETLRQASAALSAKAHAGQEG